MVFAKKYSVLHASVQVCVCVCAALPNLQFRNQIEILRLLSKCTSTYMYYHIITAGNAVDAAAVVVRLSPLRVKRSHGAAGAAAVVYVNCFP